MAVKETVANLIVAVAEITAEHSAGKASTWIRFQPKEPESLAEWLEEKNRKA